MSDDLLELLSGGKEKLAAPTRDPVDVAVRTVYGEADPNDPESWKAVAGVIRNRAKKAGQTYDQVVTAPGQFEAWSDPKATARMEGLDPNSDTYKAIAKEIAPVLNGDVAVPYDHFYSPGVLKGRGQAAPSWDDGSGKQVGSQVFFSLGDQPGDTADIFGAGDTKAADAAWQKFGSETQVDAAGNLVAKDTGKPLSPAQNKTYQTLVKGGLINPNAPAGSSGSPWMRRTADDTFKPGEFYIDLDGSLKQEPGAQNAGAGVAGAFGQGLADVGNSFAKIAPFSGDSALGNTLEANRLLYDASNEGDIGAKAGRFIGQVAGTVPLMAGGEGVLGALGGGIKAASPALAPALDFIAGRAGGNLMVRGASLASRGALEGAGASAAVSGASDVPVGEQTGAGAVLGGVLGPAAPAVRYGANRLFAPARIAAAAPEAQRLIYDAAQTLPVPVPLTTGQITLAPAQQMTENALMRGASGDSAAQVMREHAAKTQGALRGNVEAITGQMTGGVPLQPGEGGAMVSNRLNSTYDAAKKGVDDAYTAARASADGAYLPAAERGVMNQTIREAVRDYPLDGVPRVKSILDSLDQSPTSSTFTPTDIFDARAKLSTLRAGNDAVEGGAASKAVRAIDGYIDSALERDLIGGDPGVVKAWRDAISKRRDFGKLFEGNDLIDGLTERTLHGEGRTLKVSPEDAANYIFGRSDLGFVGKRDLTRDLTRLKGVIGEDGPEWGALRAEAFRRIARAGEGAPEGGSPQFSGQKFYKAWEAAKAKDPQIVQTLFTADERKLIDQFAEVAQRATTPIKGGDNASNSGVYIAALAKRALENLGTMSGGAVGSVGGPGGAAVGAGAGRVFDTFMRDVGAVVKARKATSGAAPVIAKVGEKNRLLDKIPFTATVIGGNRLLTSGAPASP